MLFFFLIEDSSLSGFFFLIEDSSLFFLKYFGEKILVFF